MPINLSTGLVANDSSTWHTFDQAVTAFNAQADFYAIGFAFDKSDDIYAIDLDGCLVDGKPTPNCMKIINLFSDCYIEKSPSDTGLRIIVKSNKKLPCNGVKCGGNIKEAIEGVKGIELYKSGHFFTITGKKSKRSSTQILYKTVEVEKIYSTIERIKSKDKGNEPVKPIKVSTNIISDYQCDPEIANMSDDTFKNYIELSSDDKMIALVNGDDSGYASHSEARMGLLTKLCFWFNGDKARILRFFETTAMYKDKEQKLSKIRSGGIAFAEIEINKAITQWEFNGCEHYSSTGMPIPKKEYILDVSTGTKTEVVVNNEENDEDLLNNANVNVKQEEEQIPITRNRVSDDMVKKAIEGTPLGEIVLKLANCTNPPLPVQYPLGQVIFALGCALSGSDFKNPTLDERKDALNTGKDIISEAEKIGAERARIRIVNSAGTGTCQTYVLQVAPKGSGKDVIGIKNKIRPSGLKVIDFATTEGYLDSCSFYPNLGVYLPEFQTILNGSETNSNYVNLLKSTSSVHYYEQVLSERQNKKNGTANRIITYMSPSFLASTQPLAMVKNLCQENVDDGFLDRFLICYYEENESLIRIGSVRDSISCEEFAKYLKRYMRIEGSLECDLYQDEFDKIFNNITGGANPTKSYEARIVNMNAYKIAIMLQGGLKIEKGIWKRVEVLLKLFIQNYHDIVGNVSEDKYDAKTFARYTKVYRCIKSLNMEGTPPNRKAILNAKGASTTKYLVEALNYYLEKGDILKVSSPTGDRYLINKGNAPLDIFEDYVFEPITSQLEPYDNIVAYEEPEEFKPSVFGEDDKN
jgi:hypothetical protein